MYMPFLRVSSIQVHAEAIFLRLFRVFFYDSIVYAVPFKHDWILMNGLFSSLNARWLCKLLWKHIYFLIGEIHKQTNTRCSHLHKRANTTTCFWPKYILTPLPFSLVFNHFAHFFFFCHQKKKTSHFHVQCLCHWCIVYFMHQHGSWKINITISFWKIYLSSIFLQSEKKMSLFSIHIYESLTLLHSPLCTTIKLNSSVFDSSI